MQAINDLAERVFNKLRTDPNRLKSEFPSKRSKRDREPGDEARSLSLVQFIRDELAIQMINLNLVQKNSVRNTIYFHKLAGIPSDLLCALAHQEPQHLSAPRGQVGDINPEDQGAPQQQRQRNDAGPLVKLTHQEPHHTSNPRMRPSERNPVDQGVRQEHE